MLNHGEVELAGGGYFPRFSLSGGVVIKRPTRKIPITLKEVEELVTPPDGTN